MIKSIIVIIGILVSLSLFAIIVFSKHWFRNTQKMDARVRIRSNH